MYAFRAERYAEAAALFRRYLSLPDAVWRQERCQAMLCLAGCCHAAGNDRETERWLLRACAESPDWAAPWDCAADHYRETGRPDAAAVCAARAKRQNTPNTV